MRFSTLRIALLGALALASSACAPHYRLTSPQQTATLPANRGRNGGSFVAETAWKYRGSKARTHEFYFYHHEQNLLERCRVSIPRENAVLHFPEAAFGTAHRWVTLRHDSKTFQFDPHSSRIHFADGFSD